MRGKNKTKFLVVKNRGIIGIANSLKEIEEIKPSHRIFRVDAEIVTELKSIKITSE